MNVGSLLRDLVEYLMKEHEDCCVAFDENLELLDYKKKCLRFPSACLIKSYSNLDKVAVPSRS